MRHCAGWMWTIIAVAAVMAVATAPVHAQTHKRVLLREVTSLALQANSYTSGRRSSPVPQMQCVGGPCQYAPSSALCHNAGTDGVDALWKCQADLEKGIKLGQITVGCEGFDYPDDPYILYGSCALEYTLVGQADVERHQQAYHHSGPSYHHSSHYAYQSGGGASSVSWFGTVFMLAVLGLIIWAVCNGPRRAAGGVNGGAGGSGSGWFPGGGGGPGYGQPGYNPSCPPPASSGPGFWTGMGAGGLMGYMMGRRSGPSYSYGAPSYAPSWGSTWGSGASGLRSMGTQSSAAFGGTRRR